MTEPRRIPLNTVKTLSKDKKSKETVPTIRFNLKLCESNDQKCPEFSYADLLRNYKKDHVKKNEDGHPEIEKDPFSLDDDSEVAEIARRFEEKYGPSKKKRHWEDYIDRGMGYDETDPFIDNDEAYDELVPSTLTTKHGGFYINRGDLDFKVLIDSDFEVPPEPRIRKRRRRMRDGSERTAEIIKRRKKAALAAASVAVKEINNLATAANNNGELKVEAKKRGRKPYAKLTSALNPLKKKSTSLSPTVAELIQQRKAAQLQQSPSRELSPPKLEKPAQIVENGENSLLAKSSSPARTAEEPAPPPLRPATAEDNVENVIESVVKAAGGGLDEASPAPPPDNDAGDDGLGRGALVIDEDQKSELSLLPPKLPDGLEPELLELITHLKEAARKSQEGKCKFFNSDVNKMLLQIEVKSKELSCTSRSVVFAHLAAFLPCTKETLLKRAKKLRLDQEDGKLKTPLLKLKEAITRAMPPLLEKYELECLRYAQEHKENEDVKSTATPDTTSNEGTTPEDANKLAPRKKFEWTPEIRQLLCDVVEAKLRCFEVAKSRMQSPEEYLRHFLDSEVRPLWPQGWMKTGTLFKESKSGHSHLTNKPKKTLVANNRKSSLKPTDSGGEGSKPPLSTGSPAALNPEQIEIIPIPPLDAKDVESKSPHEVKQPPVSDSPRTTEPIQPKKELTSSTPPPPPPNLPQSMSVSKNEKLSGEALFNKLVSATLELSRKNVAFNKLTETSRLNSATINKVSINEVTPKPILDSVTLAKSVASSSSTQRSESPNKRNISTFGSSGDLSLQASPTVGRAQPSSSGVGTSLLDHIISASLANFPNSRSSSTAETAKPEIQIMDATSGKTIQPKSLSIISPKSCENKPSHSLLKSSYATLDPSSQSKASSSTTKTLTVTSYTTLSTNKKLVEDVKLPYHSYEFNEAFKKSLQQTPVASTSSEAPKVAVTYATRDVSSPRELVVSSTEYGDEYSKFRKAQKHMNATKQEYKKPHPFPEGMKGFPLPIKQEVPSPSYSPTLVHKSPSPSRASPANFQYPASSDPRPTSSSSPWRGGTISPGYTTSNSMYQQQPQPYRTSSSSTTHPHIVTAHRSADPPNRTEPSHRTEPASHHKPVEKYSPSMQSYSSLSHSNEPLTRKPDPSPPSHFGKLSDPALYQHLARSSDLFSSKHPAEYSNKLSSAGPPRPSNDHLYPHHSSKTTMYHAKDMYGLPSRQDGYSANLRQTPSSTSSSSFPWTYSTCDNKYPPQGSQPPH